MTLPIMVPGTLEYSCELDHGTDEGTLYGWFTGELDSWGKETFQESSEYGNGQTFYFFGHEVIEFSRGYDV